MTTRLPKGFVCLPIIGDLVAVDCISEVVAKETPEPRVVVFTRSGSTFAIAATSFEGAKLVRDGIIYDMWKAENPLMGAIEDLQGRVADGDPLDAAFGPKSPRDREPK